jgi:hypothetical protein
LLAHRFADPACEIFAMRVGDLYGLIRLECMPGETPTLRCRRLDVLRALRWSLTGCAIIFACAFAAEVALTKAFNLPPDIAENSLKKFSEQSGLEVVFATETVGKIRTNAVKGEYAAREAMNRLLAGTGLVVAENLRTRALLVSRNPNAATEERPATGNDSPEKKKQLTQHLTHTSNR